MSNEVVVTIDGKKRGFKFTMLTLQYFSDHTGVEFGDIIDHFKDKPIGSIVTLLWAANTVYEKGKNGKVSRFDVDDWIAEMNQGDFQSIMDCYSESMENIVKRMSDGQEAKKK